MSDRIRPVNRSEVRHTDALRAGARVAEFEILALLGVGGFGMVYKAFDHSLHRTVAIKEYMPTTLASRLEDGSLWARSTTDGPAFKAGLVSFVEEARMLAQFDHPSLVKVFRFWEEKNTAYMVMPLYHGMSLKEARAHMRKPPSEAWLRKLLWSVLSALRVLHDANMLHRDISPENIFLQDFGPPVLLDLGASRYAINNNDAKHTVVLKVNYAPIEQYSQGTGIGIDSLAQGPWSDLYSLAAMVHGCLCNDAPLPATLRALRDRLVPFARVAKTVETQFGEAYSAEFVNAVSQALRLQPEDRPQSIDAFLALLGMSIPPTGMDHFDFRAQLGNTWVEPVGITGSEGSPAPDFAHSRPHAASAATVAPAAAAAPGTATLALPAKPVEADDGPATIFLEDERLAAREALEARSHAARSAVGAQSHKSKAARPPTSESDSSPAMKRRRAAVSASSARKRRPWWWAFFALLLVAAALAVGLRTKATPAPVAVLPPAAAPRAAPDDILTEFKLPPSADPAPAEPEATKAVSFFEPAAPAGSAETASKLDSPGVPRVGSAASANKKKTLAAPAALPVTEAAVATPQEAPAPRAAPAAAAERPAPAPAPPAKLLCADSGVLTRSSCLRAECRNPQYRSNPACVEFRNTIEPLEKNQFAN